MKRLWRPAAAKYYVFNPTNISNVLRESIYKQITPVNLLDNKLIQSAYIQFISDGVHIHHGDGDRTFNDLTNLHFITSHVHNTLNQSYIWYLDMIPDSVDVSDRNKVIQYLLKDEPSVEDVRCALANYTHISAHSYYNILMRHLISTMPRLDEPISSMKDSAETLFRNVISQINAKLGQDILVYDDMYWDSVDDKIEFFCEVRVSGTDIGFPLSCTYNSKLAGGLQLDNARYIVRDTIEFLAEEHII